MSVFLFLERIYINLSKIKIKIDFLMELSYNIVMICNDCPRKCGVDRSKQKGFCGEGEQIKIAKIIENFMWEEPCISGEKGALAIFFSGCNLRCEFCQNYQISHFSKGEEYTPKEFLALLKRYDLSRFSCIDLITPTHFTSKLIEALEGQKFSIPIVWNSSGYENVDLLPKLAEVVDVFMPDFKYFSNELSQKFSKAEDYFEVASKCIIKMRELKHKNIFTEGILQSGLLIRHLALPGQIRDSYKILDFIKEKIDSPFISLMSQFTPCNNCSIKRGLNPLEYKALLNHAHKLGLSEGYFQDFSSADEKFIPNF